MKAKNILDISYYSCYGFSKPNKVYWEVSKIVLSTSTPAPFSIEVLNSRMHQTPFLLLSLDQIEANYRNLHTSLPGVEIFYAVKSNPEPAVLQKLVQLGSCFEIASATELDLLLRLGVSSDRVIYSNPVKPWQDIEKAYGNGVTCFAFDSELEIDKLVRYSPGAEVYLRIGVSDKDSAFPFAKKFGADIECAVDLLLLAKSKGLNPYGIAFHVGSQALNPLRWAEAIRAAGGVMRELDRKGLRLKMLNIGGGFPAYYQEEVPPVEQIGKVIQQAIADYVPYKTRLIAEPGRGLVAGAGVIAASVIGRARRGDKDWLYLDISAFNGMMETLLSNNTLKYPIYTSLDARSARRGKNTDLFTLTGPTCDSQDTMLYDVELPADITLNDRIYIFTAGAYTFAYASSFNGFGPPQVYAVDGKVDV